MARDGGHRVKGTAGYVETAPELVERYESIVFADIHSDILHLIPPAPSQVLDIGAGTGRDAAALAALGHVVVAVEPTAELRIPAQRLHPSAKITWLDDALPDLAVLHERRERFDFILMSGVWFHLDAAERKAAMSRVCSLLNSAGLLALSLRHGPIPPGRRMFDVSADETIALARAAGPELIFQGKSTGLFGRTDVWWDRLVFANSAAPVA